MLLHLFRPKAADPTKYVLWVIVVLALMFAVLAETSPVVGLAGVGTLLILMGIIVELNSRRIWADYVKMTKKRGLSFWTRPNKVYYNINVYILWPFTIFLGVTAVWTAYLLG